jgi:hypothetical protein
MTAERAAQLAANAARDNTAKLLTHEYVFSWVTFIEVVLLFWLMIGIAWWGFEMVEKERCRR